VRLMVSFASMPRSKRFCVRPSRQQQKYRRVLGVRQNFETTETGSSFHQSGTVEERPAHLCFHPVANPKLRDHGDHDSHCSVSEPFKIYGWFCVDPGRSILARLPDPWRFAGKQPARECPRASSFKNRSPKCPYLGAGAISQRGLKARFLHQHVGRGGE
jgi:hypothetical protein